MNSNVVPFKTKEFPEKGIWRVHAFGEVRRNQQISSEPTVDLFIVPLKSDSDTDIDLNSSKSYDYSRLQSVQIGSGQMAGICVGSLLRDQKRMYKLPEYTNSTYILHAEKDFQGLFRAGDNYHGDEGNPHPVRILPDNYYRVPDELRKMPCLCFRAQRKEKNQNGDIILKHDTILIPCWVIFQYYYGTSNHLINALINGDLETGSNQVFNPDPLLTYHNDEDGYFYLRLRQKMFDKDAPVIARIAADERITQSAINISNSMVANYNNGNGAFPEVNLPFFGETEMELCGKNVRYGREWFFFVYYIKSCTGEYPYEKLKFDRDNDGREDLIDNPERKEAWNNNKKKHTSKPREKEGGQKITSDEPPSLRIIETQTVLPPRNFLAQPKTVRKLPKKLCKYRSAQVEDICRTNGTKRDLSTGEGENGGESARLDIKTDSDGKGRKPRESAPPNFDSIIKVLENLDYDYPSDFNYEFITVLEDKEYEDNGFSVFPNFYDGKRIAWSFIPGNPTRLRQVLTVEINFRGNYFYLFEFERRVSDSGEPKENFNTFVLHNNLTWAEESNFENILLHFAKNEGVYKKEWEFSAITREKFRHGWKIKDFAKKLIKFFNEEISKTKPQIDAPQKEQVDWLIGSDDVTKVNDSIKLVG